MRKISSIVLFFLLSNGVNAQGIILNWTGEHSQSWFDAQNWVQGNTPPNQAPIKRIPTNDEHVVISDFVGVEGQWDTAFISTNGIISVGYESIGGACCRSLSIESSRIMSFYGQIQVSGKRGGLTIAGTLLTDALIVYDTYDHEFTGNALNNVTVFQNGKIRAQTVDVKYGGIIKVYGEILRLSSNAQTLFNVTNTIGNGGAFVSGGLIEGSLVVKYGGKITIENSTVNLKKYTGGLYAGSFPEVLVDASAVFNNTNLDIRIPNEPVSNAQTVSVNIANQTLNGNIINENTSDLLTVAFKHNGTSGAVAGKTIVNGNISLHGGKFSFEHLEITGNFNYYGTAGSNYNYQNTLKINGASIFSYMANALSAGAGYPDGLPNTTVASTLTFSGTGNSNINFPKAFAVDTLVLSKSNCASLSTANPLLIYKKLAVNSGQLLLEANDGVPYKLVAAKDVSIAAAGGVLLNQNASIAIGGSFSDKNATTTNGCEDFRNPYHATVVFFKSYFTESNRVISASISKLGNVNFTGQSEILINSNVEVKSLHLEPGTKLTVAGGYKLSVKNE